MTKLEVLNLEVKNLRSHTARSNLESLINKGIFDKALYFTVGCLMYCNDTDREALVKIKELLL